MSETNCLNCGAALQGKFCHACGQKAASGHLGMHDFAHEAAHEFLHLDGKILKTVKMLIIRPGELTREFLAGRRARYISPVRLYLTFSLIFSSPTRSPSSLADVPAGMLSFTTSTLMMCSQASSA